MEYGNITKLLKNSQQNNSDTVTNENDKEIPKKRHIYLQKRQKTIDKLDINSIIIEYHKIINLLDNTSN